MSAGTVAAPADPGVDPRKVVYYRQLADRWWDESGPFWPLHGLNRLRTGYLRDRLSIAFGRDPGALRPLAGLRVLDVGCGGGLLSEAIARLGADVHGIDVTARNLEVAALHAAASGLQIGYELTSPSELARRGQSYDVVLDMEVVEHVPVAADHLSDCARVLRRGGSMVVATINRTASSWLLAIVGAEYVLRWLPVGTHRWGRFVTPGELEKHLRAGGLEIVHRTGVKVNPVTRGFSLTPSLRVNYMAVARKL